MARKDIKTQHESVQNIKAKDTRYLRFITRKLLHSVEKTVDLFNNEKYAELEALAKTNILLFGSKASLAETLVTLADLMIKLNQIQRTEDSRTYEEEQSAYKFADADIALIQVFLKKIKEENALVSD